MLSRIHYECYSLRTNNRCIQPIRISWSLRLQFECFAYHPLSITAHQTKLSVCRCFAYVCKWRVARRSRLKTIERFISLSFSLSFFYAFSSHAPKSIIDSNVKKNCLKIIIDSMNNSNQIYRIDQSIEDKSRSHR